jgi:hypothetical protein
MQHVPCSDAIRCRSNTLQKLQLPPRYVKIWLWLTASDKCIVETVRSRIRRNVTLEMYMTTCPWRYGHVRHPSKRRFKI